MPAEYDPMEEIYDRRGSISPTRPDVKELIVRVDERTNVLLQEVRAIKESTVTRAEFNPVRSVVYGLVALIMTGVVIALLGLVVAGR